MNEINRYVLNSSEVVLLFIIIVGLASNRCEGQLYEQQIKPSYVCAVEYYEQTLARNPKQKQT